MKLILISAILLFPLNLCWGDLVINISDNGTDTTIQFGGAFDVTGMTHSPLTGSSSGSVFADLATQLLVGTHATPNSPYYSGVGVRSGSIVSSSFTDFPDHMTAEFGMRVHTSFVFFSGSDVVGNVHSFPSATTYSGTLADLGLTPGLDFTWSYADAASGTGDSIQVITGTPAAVPEPSGALLSLIALAPLLRRRRPIRPAPYL